MPIPPPPDLSGKVAIVTGASRGIGRALAVGLADAGAAVVCAARTEVVRPGGLPGTIHTTADAIRAAGGEALPYRCDVGEPDEVTALVETTVQKLGRVDVLVNNAMTPTRALFDETPLELWDESMRVNVRSRTRPRDGSISPPGGIACSSPVTCGASEGVASISDMCRSIPKEEIF